MPLLIILAWLMTGQGAVAPSALAPRDLAAAYLSNHYRLDRLARQEPGTGSDAQQFRRELQDREEALSAEIRGRGVPKIGGAYRMDLSQPCPGESPDPVFVDLIQDDFNVRVRRTGAVGGDLVAGVVTAGTLTLGEGEFNPDKYSSATIGADGRIPLRTFSGVGCTMVLTRR